MKGGKHKTSSSSESMREGGMKSPKKVTTDVQLKTRKKISKTQGPNMQTRVSRRPE